MTAFVLRLDLSSHQHPGNPAAQHALVRQMLNLAMQAIGSNLNRKGELSIPLWDASEGLSRHIAIGSWEFTETRNPAAEA
jgi:hypothetical protein